MSITNKVGPLAKRMGRDEQELLELLEGIADEGLVFTLRNQDGELECSLTPFFPGAWEFQLMRGTDTLRYRKLAKMTHEFLKGLQDMIAETMETPRCSRKSCRMRWPGLAVRTGR